MPKQIYKRCADNTEQIVISNLKIANTYITRLIGLLGTKALNKEDGLLISPCMQVHTHMMRYPIDVIFLTKELRVIHVIENMKPWKLSPFFKSSYYVLETSAELKAGIEVGDQLVVK